MTNSATSTDASASARGSGFQAWHFFTLLAMIGATAVVMVSKETHPAALIMLSAAVIAAGFVGLAISRAITGFMSGGIEPGPVSGRSREEIERQKMLVLRSLKELEFDKAMGKVSEADFGRIAPRLRARAIVLMKDLENTPVVASQPSAPPAAPRTAGFCSACGTPRDKDARFCKSCGARLEAVR
jgi:hypothetical protein